MIFFTVIDLANAFSIPVEADSQYWFAFTFRGKRYTWSRLEQFQFSSRKSTVLIQYVDDILLCSTDQDSCTRDSLELLTFLASQGHKVKREKLQFALPEVKYLGHNRENHWELTESRRFSTFLNRSQNNKLCLFWA